MADGPHFKSRPSRRPWLVALLIILLAAGGTYWYLAGDDGQTIPESPTAQNQADQPAESQAQVNQDNPAQVTGSIPEAPAPLASGDVVEIPGPGQTTQDQQADRKEAFGLDKSVDAVARSDEVIKIGDVEIPVAELERKLVVESRGEVLDKPVAGGKTGAQGDNQRKIQAWGLYLVRPGENLWNIHFRLLKEYMNGKHYRLPKDADEPEQGGRSSGVGKILKFAENMVGVYNLETGHMSDNLNQLEAGQKVVVFNLTEIFAQLAKVDPQQINQVMFDGRMLFFPQASDKKG